MNNLITGNVLETMALIAAGLVILQITFGFLMRKHKKAFLRYHQIIGILLFLLILANVILFPVTFFISIPVLVTVTSQITIGILISLGVKDLVKYHRPLGISITVLIVTNLVMAFYLAGSNVAF